MRVYVVGEGPVGILVAHDIFGGDSGRHKQLCDALAESSGYVVAMPDLFHDSFSSEEREIKLWKVRDAFPERSLPRKRFPSDYAKYSK
jgi:dienelactone hydrolase